MYHQEGGKQYQHLVLSHDSAVRDARLAHKVGMEVANFYGQNCQVAVFTHTDTEHLHSHLIVNTVNMYTGKKLSQGKEACGKIKRFADNILRSHGLEPIGGKDIFEYGLCEEYFEYEESYEEDEMGMDELLDIVDEIEDMSGIIRPLHFIENKSEKEEAKKYLGRIENRQCGEFIRPVHFVNERKEVMDQRQFIMRNIRK